MEREKQRKYNKKYYPNQHCCRGASMDYLKNIYDNPPTDADHYPPDVLAGYEELGKQGWSMIKNFLFPKDQTLFQNRLQKIKEKTQNMK